MSGRTLAILFVVALVLGGIVYFMSQQETDPSLVDPVGGTFDPDATPIPSPTPPINLVRDTTINEVRRLEVTRLEDDFQVAFVREEDGSWFQVVPTDTMVISGTMESNVTRIVNMTSQTSLAADANPLTAYGLDNPQFEIVLVAERDGNDVRHVFTIGSLTPTGDRYYAQKQGDPRIHVLLSATVESMTGLLEERPFVVPTPETAEPG
jgi:hypothetical protein